MENQPRSLTWQDGYVLGRSSIYQLIWSKPLVPIRIGRGVRFSVDQLERFVAERAADPLPETQMNVEWTAFRRHCVLEPQLAVT